jgi:hypothetical protein
MKEEWRNHPNWDIEVSDYGRIRKNGKVAKLSKRGDGYLVVSVGGRGMPILRVHRLVLEVFTGPCPDGLEARHLDGNSLNNKHTNLRWGTRKEQIMDQKKHGTFSRPPCTRGVDNPSYRYTDGELIGAIELVKRGLSQREVSRRTGISRTHIRRFMNGTRSDRPVGGVA